MKKQRFHYSVSGYRWAPESFHVGKGLAGQPKAEVPLTVEERHEVGCRFLTESFRAAVGYVKHIERKYERERQISMTYGFWSKEDPKRYIYCPQLRCKAAANIKERLYIFKELRRRLENTGGTAEISAQCELDGHYNPVNIRKNVVTADFSRPLKIWLESA